MKTPVVQPMQIYINCLCDARVMSTTFLLAISHIWQREIFNLMGVYICQHIYLHTYSYICMSTRLYLWACMFTEKVMFQHLSINIYMHIQYICMYICAHILV